MQNPKKPRSIKWEYIVPIIVAIITALAAIIAAVITSKGQSSAPIQTITPLSTPSRPLQSPATTSVQTPIGTPTLNDPLSGQDENQWAVGTYNDGYCKFIGGTYHARGNNNGSDNFCTSGNSDFSNFTYQVNMQIISGDCGGIIFRADDVANNFYSFEICQDGSYDFLIYKKDNASSVINQKVNSAIYTGLQIQNIIKVVANGNVFDLYVNNKKIDSVTNSTFSHGQIGIIAKAKNNPPTEVAFSNAEVWVP